MDASVICLDSKLNLVEIISKENLETDSGAIRHCGDEEDGDAKGDDERIRIYLNEVDEKVEHLIIVVKSANEHPLDSVRAASCRLFASGKEKKDLALYYMEQASKLKGHTAVFVGSLYRGGSSDEDWNFRVIAEPADGKCPEENVDEAQKYLKENPLEVPRGLPEPSEEALEDSRMLEAEEAEEEEVVVSLEHVLANGLLTEC